MNSVKSIALSLMLVLLALPVVYFGWSILHPTPEFSATLAQVQSTAKKMQLSLAQLKPQVVFTDTNDPQNEQPVDNLENEPLNLELVEEQTPAPDSQPSTKLDKKSKSTKQKIAKASPTISSQQVAEETERLKEDLEILTRSGNLLLDEAKKQAGKIQNKASREQEFQRISLARQRLQRSINSVKNNLQEVELALQDLKDKEIIDSNTALLKQVDANIITSLNNLSSSGEKLIASIDRLTIDAKDVHQFTGS